MKSSSGLAFRKLDLHLHTPGSKDFGDKTVTAEAIVDAAIAKGLDGIAVTDHNTAEWVDKIKEAAYSKPLTVFPGVEITCNGGKSGIHIIALFDPSCDKRHVDALLARLEFKPEQHGDLLATVNKDPTEVVKIIKECDGIPVLAHVNSSNGAFEEITGQQRISLIRCKHVCAVEATDFQNPNKLASRKRVVDLLDGTDPNYKRKLAVYQASDNPNTDSHGHSVEGIGTRCSHFKLEKINLRGLRQCFNDPDVRIRQDYEYTHRQYPIIEEVHVDGGFLDKASVHFHNGLNSVLGGKGTGKSLLVELMRFALDQPSSISAVKEDHQNKLKERLKEYSSVTLRFRDSTGLSRELKREFRSGEGSAYIPEPGYDVSQLFPVLFLSQNEIIKIAEDEGAQIAFIDKFFDFKLHQSKISDIKWQMTDLDSAFAESIRASHEEQVLRKAYQTFNEEIKRIDASLVNPVFIQFAKGEQKKQAFEEQLAFIDEQVNLHQEEARVFSETQPPQPPQELVEDPAFKRIESVMTSLKGSLEQKREESIRILLDAKKQIEKEYEAWKPQLKTVDDSYQAFIRQSGGDYKALVQDRSKKVLRMEEVRKNLVLHQTKSKRLTALAAQRKALLAKLKEAHEGYSSERKGKCSALETQSGGRLKIRISESSNTSDFKEKLVALKKGSYIKDVEIEEISTKVDPTTFVSCLVNYGISGKPEKLQPITDKSGIDPSRVLALAAFLNATYSYETILGIQHEATPQDRPEILLRVSDEGGDQYEPLNRLSIGQKCAAMLIIALSEGSMPIVIDQPEDSLDIRSIWEDVCIKIRHGKENRQFIFTTHNSSLAVASDTDSFTILEGTSSQGRVVHSGSMDHDPINENVMRYLEGGKPTYFKKYKKYDLTLQDGDE